jgi:DNA-binding GntR family transcriptional regulator
MVNFMKQGHRVSNHQANGSTGGRHISSSGLLKDQAYVELKRRILEGDYPPGSFLAERQLADDLGMSKTPVKAALERLEYEGFIAVSPQQGILVRELSIGEIADQYEIRAALESFAVRTLAGKLSPEQISLLQANLTEQQLQSKKCDVDMAVKLDSSFHLLFPTFLNNQEILRVMNQLREKMGMIIATVFQTHHNRIVSSYAEHKAIAEAVIEGNGFRAAELIEEHLEYGKSLILSRRRK